MKNFTSLWEFAHSLLEFAKLIVFPLEFVSNGKICSFVKSTIISLCNFFNTQRTFLQASSEFFNTFFYVFLGNYVNDERETITANELVDVVQRMKIIGRYFAK